MPTWRCRPYRPGDETRLAALFETVFDRTMTSEHWVWKLVHEPSEVANVWLAVDEADHPVGQYAGIPRRVRVGGRDYRIMVAVDAMTHPAFRSRGVLTEVVGRAHAAWRSAGLAFVLGMPNEQWGSRRVALGWQPVTSLRWMVSPLKVEAVLARRMNWPVLSKLTLMSHLWHAWWDVRCPPGVVVSEVAGTEAAAVFNDMSVPSTSGHGASLHQDPPWMRRRLLERPSSPYRVLVARDGPRVLGYTVYQIQRIAKLRVGTVTDFGTSQSGGGVGRWLLRETARRLRADGAETAMALAVPGACDDRELRQAGFHFRRGTFSVDAVMLDARLPIDTLRGAHWMLRGSDFDLI